MQRTEGQWAQYERSAIHEYDILQEQYNEEVETHERDRQRLRRVLHRAKEWKELHLWRKTQCWDIESKRRWGVRWSSVWKAAAKKHRDWHRTWKKRALKDASERDELERQLKEVTDCIIHYAPSSFAVLSYDSAAEALAALFEGGDSNESLEA